MEVLLRGLEDQRQDDPGEGNFRCENCTACYDCRFCVGCDSCEGCTYCEECLDCAGCTQCKRSVSCSKSTYLDDCRECDNSRYLSLCVQCTECLHCLGCVGLNGAEFCVLNEQYSRKEYFNVLRRVQALMEERLAKGWRPGPIGLSDVEQALAPDPVPDQPAREAWPETRWDGPAAPGDSPRQGDGPWQEAPRAAEPSPWDDPEPRGSSGQPVASARDSAWDDGPSSPPPHHGGGLARGRRPSRPQPLPRDPAAADLPPPPAWDDAPQAPVSSPQARPEDPSGSSSLRRGTRPSRRPQPAPEPPPLDPSSPTGTGFSRTGTGSSRTGTGSVGRPAPGEDGRGRRSSSTGAAAPDPDPAPAPSGATGLTRGRRPPRR